MTLYSNGRFVAAIAYLWLNLNGLDPQNYRGLTQRIFSSINSLWPAVVAVLLLSKRYSSQAESRIEV